MNSCFKDVLYSAHQMQVPVAPTAAPAEEPIRVWLVDDDTGLASLTAELLNKFEGIDCPRIFASTRSLLETLWCGQAPDVILLDLHLGFEDGIEAVPEIQAAAPRTRILVLSRCYDSHHEARAVQAGAIGLLTKHEMGRLVQGIRRARGGAMRVNAAGRLR